MMVANNSEGRAPGPDFPAELYRRMLDETREMADKALDRLRELSNQLPDGVLEQVERLHEDPTHERRKAARVSDLSIPVAVQIVDLAGVTEGTAMKDHCPTGLAVLLPCPAGVGTLLRVRLPKLGQAEWVSVEVRYCRRQGDRWVAGCELLSNQPPL
jgi:hypothetical protein